MYEDPNICEACLSKDRKLVIINRIRPLIVYLDIKELAKSQGCICWECYTTIIKFNKFRCIAREVQEILAKESEHCKSYSHLGIKIINQYDYQFEYVDPKIQENETTEPILIKQEPDNDSDKGTVFDDVGDCKWEKNWPSKRLVSKKFSSKRLSKERSKGLPEEIQTVTLTEKILVSKNGSEDMDIEFLEDMENQFSEEFQTDILSEEEEICRQSAKKLTKEISDVSKEIEMLDTKRLPSKRLSAKKSKDKPEDKFEMVALNEERTESKRFTAKRLPSKRLSAKKSKDKPEDIFEMVVLNEERTESKRFTAKRLPSKRLSGKKSKDKPKDNLEMVVLNEEKTESKQFTAKRLPEKKISAKRSAENTADLSDKFEMVTLTEEEVKQSREEKRSHHNYKKLPYKCDYCVLGFTKKDYYDHHMDAKHDESKGTPCDVCSVRFTNLVLLKNHRQLHYQYFRCKLCEYKGNRHMAIVNHVTEKHKFDTADKIHCKLCSHCFRNREEISVHMRIDHTFYCNECGEKLKTKGSLKLHLKRLHTMKREFVCPDCKKTFSTRSRLETHLTHHSSSLAKRLAYCTVCHVQYKDLAVYRSHLRHSVKHVLKRIPCPDCDKKFASKAYWKKHYNFYHLKKSQHKCDECNKLFMSHFLLKVHRQKYHGLTRPRNHLCNVCQKRFYTITNLRTHMQIHSSLRAYMCAKCGDTFKQRPALYTHQKLVHSDSK